LLRHTPNLAVRIEEPLDDGILASNGKPAPTNTSIVKFRRGPFLLRSRSRHTIWASAKPPLVDNFHRCIAVAEHRQRVDDKIFPRMAHILHERFDKLGFPLRR